MSDSEERLDRIVSQPFNGLTPAEAERLALLSEELGEAQQAIGKILRHGYESRHPGGGPTNRESLIRELGDIQAAQLLMISAQDISHKEMHLRATDKLNKVGRYLHHQSG